MNKYILIILACILAILSGCTSAPSGLSGETTSLSSSSYIATNDSSPEPSGAETSESNPSGTPAGQSTAAASQAETKISSQGTTQTPSTKKKQTTGGSSKQSGQSTKGSSEKSESSKPTGQTPAKVTVSKVTISQDSASLVATETLKLSATVSPSNAANKDITWSSSDSSVASVDGNGKVTGKKGGTATITAKTANGKKTSCSVTVKDWVAFAISYGKSIGLIHNSGVHESWDNPIAAGNGITSTERNIKNRLDGYKNIEKFTYFNVWMEPRSDGKFNIYIAYA